MSLDSDARNDFFAVSYSRNNRTIQPNQSVTDFVLSLMLNSDTTQPKVNVSRF